MLLFRICSSQKYILAPKQTSLQRNKYEFYLPVLYFSISVLYLHFLIQNINIMAQDLFIRYIWLVDTINNRPEGLTFEEINED